MLRRCDEAERKTLFVISQCRLHNLFLKKCKFVEQLSEVTLAHAEEKKKVSQLYKTNFVQSVHRLFDVVEKDISDVQRFIEEQNERARQMKEEVNHLIEYYTVLKKTASMIFREDE